MSIDTIQDLVTALSSDILFQGSPNGGPNSVVCSAPGGGAFINLSNFVIVRGVYALYKGDPLQPWTVQSLCGVLKGVTPQSMPVGVLAIVDGAPIYGISYVVSMAGPSDQSPARVNLVATASPVS